MSASSRARAVVAGSWLPTDSEPARTAVEKSFKAAAAATRRALTRRWPESEVVFSDAQPVDAILAEAKRFAQLAPAFLPRDARDSDEWTRAFGIEAHFERGTTHQRGDLLGLFGHGTQHAH